MFNKKFINRCGFSILNLNNALLVAESSYPKAIAIKKKFNIDNAA